MRLSLAAAIESSGSNLAIIPHKLYKLKNYGPHPGRSAHLVVGIWQAGEVR